MKTLAMLQLSVQASHTMQKEMTDPTAHLLPLLAIGPVDAELQGRVHVRATGERAGQELQEVVQGLSVHAQVKLLHLHCGAYAGAACVYVCVLAGGRDGLGT